MGLSPKFSLLTNGVSKVRSRWIGLSTSADRIYSS